MKQVFDELDVNKNGFLEKREFGALLERLGHKMDGDILNDSFEQVQSFSILDGSAPKGGYFIEEKSSPLANTAGHEDVTGEVPGEVPAEVTAPDASGNGKVKESKTWIEGEVHGISFEQFDAWYRASDYFQEKKEKIEQEAALHEESMNLDFPYGESWSAQAWWWLTYPVVSLLFVTLADVRRPEMDKPFTATTTFVKSIFWAVQAFISRFCSDL